MLNKKKVKGKKALPMKKNGRILNCLPSPKPENDWTLDSAQKAGLVSAAPSLPNSVDLREDWWTIGDQGLTGSCVGWASADGVLRWHFVKAGRLDKKTSLSVRYIWMAAKETDEFTTRPTSFIESDGTSLKAALDIARKYGMVIDSELPFSSGKLYGGEEAVFYSRAATRRIAGYFSLHKLAITPSQRISSYRVWLATQGPILTRFTVDKTFDGLNNDDSGTLDVYRPYPPETPTGGHAITIVGYTPTSFIVRNSWGTGWGDNGFGYASRKYTVSAFTEAYGVFL
jgi:hypothetical protein